MLRQAVRKNSRSVGDDLKIFYLRRFLLMNQLRVIGLVAFLSSRKVFLFSVARTQVSARDLQRLQSAASSALMVLRKYPFEPASKKSYGRGSKPGRFPAPDFLRALPNVRNVDSLFGSCLALFGSASLQDSAVASHPLRITISDALREIRFHTWTFSGEPGNISLEKFDASLPVEDTQGNEVYFPELAALSANVYESTVSRIAVDSPVSGFETFEECGFTSSGALWSDERLIILHSSQRPDNYFYSGQNEYRALTDSDKTLFARVSDNGHTNLREAVYIYCRESTNLYHWLMEVLPVALQVQESFGRRLPIILRGPVHRKFIGDLHKAVRNPIHVFTRGDIGGVFVDRLHVRSAPVNTTDSFSPDYTNVISSFDRPAIDRVRKWYLKEMNQEPFGFEKVFLSRRSGHRGLSNESRLEELAASRGFVAINPATLSSSKQVALFSRAKVMVGAGGGVMGNYLFASPGSKIAQLVADQNLRLPAPALICQVSGATLYSAVGKSKPARSFRSPLDWQNSDFKVSEQVFSDLLDQMEQ